MMKFLTLVQILSVITTLSYTDGQLITIHVQIMYYTQHSLQYTLTYSPLFRYPSNLHYYISIFLRNINGILLYYVLHRLTLFYYTVDSECKEPLLDGALYRVIDNYFTASGSLNESHQPYEARLNGSGWCANEQGFNIFDPWLQVEFGTDVKINRITIMGAELDKTLSYVSHFQLEYCNHNSYAKTKVMVLI